MKTQTTFNAISKVEVVLGYAHNHSLAVFCAWAVCELKRKNLQEQKVNF